MDRVKDKAEEMFFGLGRTWTVALIMMVMSSVMVFMGKMDVDTWQSMMYASMGMGGIKSTAVGVANAVKK